MSEQAQILRKPIPRWWPFVVMGVGVFAVSTAAIFIRLAQEENAPSLVIAAARMLVASLVLTVPALRNYSHEFSRLTRGDIGLVLFGGGVLGLHFATWITSLEYTSVVNSVVLVTTNPLWVALLAPFFLKEKLGRFTIIGLMLAFGGGLLVALTGAAGDPPNRSDPLLGNGLAVIGAIMASIYFVIGRKLRGKLSLVPYVWLIYGVAAIVLIVAVILTGQQVGGLAWQAYVWMALMGLTAQLIGHSSFNYALGYLPAAYVSLVVLGEPIGSGILAMIFLDEWPVILQIVGSALILFGIGVASRDQLKSAPAPENH